MPEQTTDSRKEIIRAAREEFLNHGYEGARMQRIADRIGVTKAMIHYYFNTKKKLFEHVYTQSLQSIFGGFNEVLEKDAPLFSKIEMLIETCLQHAGEQPVVLAFIITESGRKRDWLQPILEEHIQVELQPLNLQLQEAAANYEITAVDARVLLLNIFSLCYYPALASSIHSPLLRLNSGGADLNRKGVVLDTVLNWLTA